MISFSSAHDHLIYVLFTTHLGQPTSAITFSHVLHQVSISIRIDHLFITPHSFQISTAKTAAALSIPADIIQSMGHWSSSAFLHYIRLQVVSLNKFPFFLSLYFLSSPSLACLIWISTVSLTPYPHLSIVWLLLTPAFQSCYLHVHASLILMTIFGFHGHSGMILLSPFMRLLLLNRRNDIGSLMMLHNTHCQSPLL